MSSGMQSLLESEDLVDVTLAVEGRYLKAHKMVLSVCSPYFRELFQTNPCKHPIVFMKDVSYIALSDLLQFMYQGEVQVAQENLSTFIKTAEALQIKGLTGDNGSQNDSETAEQTEIEKPAIETTTKRTHEVVETKPTPATRVKKLAGPASKRPRYVLPTSESTPVLNQSTPTATVVTTSHKVDVATPSTPTTEELIQFKMEPAETREQSQIEGVDDSQVAKYGDESAIDDLQDDTEDYSLMETGDDEPKPGTSADGMGDGQDENLSMPENKHAVQNRKYGNRMRLVVDGFVYHNSVIRDKPGIRYLICAHHRKFGCRARAHVPLYGDKKEIQITRTHNHPPDECAEERDLFLTQLKAASTTLPGSLRHIYASIALIYPKAAFELPYKQVASSMNRWRRQAKLSKF